jgi:redox-sensing transcriptional repressor
MNTLNPMTLNRLMGYYHYIVRHIGRDNDLPLSSARLSKLLHIDDTQIRKDMAIIGIKGHPHVGFSSRQIVGAIRGVLGFDLSRPAVVVGAGRLGGALASFKDFRDYGLRTAAIFDNNPQKIGQTIGDQVVQPMDQIETIVRQSQAQLGILTVPAHAAQDVADRLIQAGLTALWNFAPIRIVAPDHVTVRHEHLAVGLAQLLYRLQNPSPPDGHPA